MTKCPSAPTGPRPWTVPRIESYTTKPNSLKVVRTSDYLQYIKPPPKRETDYDFERPREDFLVEGLVVVNLTKRRKVGAMLWIESSPALERVMKETACVQS